MVDSRGLAHHAFLPIAFGGTGVKLFFVISGFVMAYSIKERSQFLINRAVRIYPSYWFTILLSYCLLSSFRDWTFDFQSFFLVPGNLTYNNSYAIPYWTLIYELFFYILLYLISFWANSAEKMGAFCAFWMLSIFVVNKYHPIIMGAPAQLILFSPANLYFISGLVFALNEELLQKNHKPLLMILLSLALWGCTLDFQAELINAVALGLLVYYGKHSLQHPALVKLGDCSYGIYLIHVPILLIVIHLAQKIHPQLQLRYLWGSVFLITLLGSVLFGKLEYQVYRTCKRLLSNARPFASTTKYSVASS